MVISVTRLQPQSEWKLENKWCKTPPRRMLQTTVLLNAALNDKSSGTETAAKFGKVHTWKWMLKPANSLLPVFLRKNMYGILWLKLTRGRKMYVQPMSEFGARLKPTRTKKAKRSGHTLLKMDGSLDAARRNTTSPRVTLEDLFIGRHASARLEQEPEPEPERADDDEMPLSKVAKRIMKRKLNE